MSRHTRLMCGVGVLTLALFSSAAIALEFDEDVTPDAIFGSGNANGFFTVDRNDGVELGLRAKIPFVGTIQSNGDGTYSYTLAQLLTAHPSQRWNFDWTVNTDWDGSTGLKIDDLTYLLQLDYDPSVATNFLEFDPITPNIPPLNAPFFDHSIGDNTTPNGGGAEATDGPTYANLTANNNVAQQSWRYSFFPIHPTLTYDSTIDGTYDVVLSAYHGGTLVAQTSIQVIIGAGGCSDDILQFGLAAGSECVQPLETVEVELHQLNLSGDVRGFQAFAQYDDGILTSNGLATLTVTPFGKPILNSVSGGLIDLANGIDNLAGQPTTDDDALLATLSFTAGSTEGPTAISFRTTTFPTPPTRFTDPAGLEVTPCLIPSPIILIDGSDPVITCPADITIECDESTDPSNTGRATAVDAFDTQPEITFVDSSAAGGCDQEEAITRTWTATDCAGNTDVCVQVITVVDNTDPVITCPDDVTVDCSDSTAPSNTGIPTHFEGFEDPGFVAPPIASGIPGWQSYYSFVDRVTSGTAGITSKNGVAHGVITPNSGGSWSGAFSRLGGYSTVFPAGGFTTALDVYMDLSDPAVVADTYGWDLSSAANGQDGNHQRDFIFHTASNASGEILVGASNNTNFTRRNDIASLNHYVITGSGWYTFECDFHDKGDGTLEVDLNLRDAGGTLLWTETRNSASDIIATEVGGNRYMWFTFLETDYLAIDNTRVTGIQNASDNCDPAPVITSVDNFVAAPPGCHTGVIERTWTATDDCGNSDDCVQLITITDTNGPVLTVPADVVVTNDPGMCDASFDPGTATATDDCDATPDVTGTRSDGLALNDPYPAKCDCGTVPGTINTRELSENGWFSDDTRADGTGTEAAGTNLISDTLTDDPEATASGTSAHDADILNQITFGPAAGTVPAGTHTGAVHLTIAPGVGAGKSQISHRKDDGVGFAPGSVFGPGIAIEYSWMGDGTPTVTASLKFGIKTSEFAGTGVSGRTGENVWDKVLIYEPGQGNGNNSDGTWRTETIDYSTGRWWFFDRTNSAPSIGTPLTLADMSTSSIMVGGRPISAVYSLITAPGAHITSVQVGIGSGNAGGSVYVNQVETNFYRAGNLTTFGCDDSTTITWQAEDCAGNTVTADQKVTVLDTELPVISGLTVTGGDVDGACEHTVTFSATVTDNCCVDADDVTVAVALLTGNATLGTPNISKGQTDGETVTITGDVLVSDLTSCPATVEVTIDAVDCCGNNAVQVQDTADVNDNEDPVVSAPADISVNADAGLCTASINPGMASATDNCDGSPTITWTRSDGAGSLTDPYDSADSPITITWQAEDDCGNTHTMPQVITVDAENELVVTVELEPNIDTGNPLPDTLDRCITFELWDCPGSSTVPAHTLDAVITFDVVAGAPNTAIGTATLEVPCGVYECITARDKLHTLRRTDESFGIVGTQYVADFTGDTDTGGDWLLGGNLNDDFFIDILDFGVFSLEFGNSYPGGGDTTCATAYPHADISGDGVVTNVGEFTFIQNNFLKTHEANCCGAAMRFVTSDVFGQPVTNRPLRRISLAELKRRGMGELAVGDLNRDGWLDVQDMNAFATGVRPQSTQPLMQPTQNVREARDDR
jgi:hypothetical protein